MTYSVKEAFYTLQGEGAHTGRAAVFLRFAGCNLWSGLERDREKAVCRFCDTDFVGTNGEGAENSGRPLTSPRMCRPSGRPMRLPADAPTSSAPAASP